MAVSYSALKQNTSQEYLPPWKEATELLLVINITDEAAQSRSGKWISGVAVGETWTLVGGSHNALPRRRDRKYHSLCPRS